MIDQVLNLDGRVVGESRELSVELFDDSQAVGGSVEEVRVSEGDVLGACPDLSTYVLQNRLTWHGGESTAVHRDDRAVPTGVFAPAGGFGVPDHLLAYAWDPEPGVLIE